MDRPTEIGDYDRCKGVNLSSSLVEDGQDKNVVVEEDFESGVTGLGSGQQLRPAKIHGRVLRYRGV
jgi:hypothetical protein